MCVVSRSGGSLAMAGSGVCVCVCDDQVTRDVIVMGMGCDDDVVPTLRRYVVKCNTMEFFLR